MLNRRHLRVKVLQSLYAFHQSNKEDLAAGEKELLLSIDKVYDLYLYQLSLLAELLAEEERIIEENLRKKLPADDDLNPNRRFLKNQCLLLVANHEGLQKLNRERHISWQNERELIRKLMLEIRGQNYYRQYLEADDPSLDADIRFVVKLLKQSILPFESLHSFYEENSIYWLVDWELVNKMLIRTLKMIPDQNAKLSLMGLFKDPSDKIFARDLFNRTIVNRLELERIISDKTKNWEPDRIAMMDMLIMEMAVTEILKFPEIPVKVSLNEYIELSKMYSTPKSNVFVNGVLDKLVEDFYENKLLSRHVSGLSGNASE